MELRLTELRDGESGIVTSITASQGRGWGGRRAGRGWGLKRRLEDMGLTPGTRIKVVKSAPFLGPLEVHVRSSRLVIGKGIPNLVELITFVIKKRKRGKLGDISMIAWVQIPPPRSIELKPVYPR